MAKPIVVKIGGSTLGNHDTTLEDLVELQKQSRPVVVVHGGGKIITDWLTKLGVASKFVQGERVTDQPTLEVVTAVLAGLVNKDIVASIERLGGRTVGISGVDGGLIEGRIKEPEKGYVGETTRVNTEVLDVLLKAGFIPVVAPIGFNPLQNQTGAPLTLNFNADTVAGDIAAAIGARTLVFLTDVTGVLDGNKKLLPRLLPEEAEALITSGLAAGGMIPKIKACLAAIKKVPATCIIDGRQPHALLKELNGESSGTVIVPGR